MKDYFNSSEREQLVTFIKALDHGGIIEANWGKRGNLTKDELKALRMVITWGKKFVTSIITRQNTSAKKALRRTIETSNIMLDYTNNLLELYKKRSADIDAAYEENRDYFKLIELIMFYNCMDCTRTCTECEIYKEFEERNIPEITGFDDFGNCKYSYYINFKEEKK